MERTWSPHRRQSDFISLPDTIFEALFGGAAGGGKSEVLLLAPIVRRWHESSKFKALLLRRTYPELEKELILRSREFFPAAGATYSDEKKRWSFPSGAIFQFGHAEFEQDIRKYDTSEYNYLAYDELTSFTEFQYLYLTSRCRSSTPSLPAICRAATNPGNVGHGWVRKRFVEPSCPGQIILDKVTGTKRIYIHAKATDNPTLMRNDPDYVRRLELLPEAEKRAKLYGDWFTFEGQVFDDWRESPLPSEPDNASHVVKDFPIPDWWPRLLAIDWGFSAMFYALWGAISPERRLVIYREYAAKREKVSTCAAEIARLTQSEELDDCVIDPSAFANRGDEKTVVEQFETHSGLRVRRADNDRVGGKVLVQDYLRFRPKPPRKIVATTFDPNVATVVLRQRGLDSYNEYLNSFKPEPSETNLPRLQVFKSCEILRRTIPLCVYDGHRKEDVASFDGDDPYDTLRYLVKAADYLMAKSHKDLSYRSEVSAVLQQLQDSGNQTRFYRRMEMAESRQRVGVRAVKRYHRRAYA